jgi:hypothetical protein
MSVLIGRARPSFISYTAQIQIAKDSAPTPDASQQLDNRPIDTKAKKKSETCSIFATARSKYLMGSATTTRR